MKTGAERNKIILLGALTAVLAVTVYVQFFSSTSTPAPARRVTPAAAPKQTASQAITQSPRAPAKAVTRARGQGFRPRFAPDASAEGLDPMSVDPTLRTDLLASVRAVEFSGVSRNIFQFGERKRVAPPPDPKAVAQAQQRLEALSKPAPPPAPAAPQTPKAPPIQFKYYGFANQPDDPIKRAFLLDGEDILIGVEGQVFKNRYKIVRIGVNSIVMEDMQFNDQQTLQLQQQG
jgi:hypothetical protein